MIRRKAQKPGISAPAVPNQAPVFAEEGTGGNKL